MNVIGKRILTFKEESIKKMLEMPSSLDSFRTTRPRLELERIKSCN
jgi:hypothetical protein